MVLGSLAFMCLIIWLVKGSQGWQFKSVWLESNMNLLFLWKKETLKSFSIKSDYPRSPFHRGNSKVSLHMGTDVSPAMRESWASRRYDLLCIWPSFIWGCIPHALELSMKLIIWEFEECQRFFLWCFFIFFRCARAFNLLVLLGLPMP
jgi:hypothetical protein